jgi:GNAT superfamily N-acetyltransferase
VSREPHALPAEAIRPARPDEAEAISALALRSKAHWPYGSEQLAVFRRELTLAAGDVVARRAHVLVEDGQLVGFYTLTRREGDAELEHLFVEPARLGRGLGSALFRHACALARREGFGRLVIQSDPNAAGFYAALGARLERHVPSSIPGRELPLFSVWLESL